MRTLSFLRLCRAKGMIGAAEALNQYETERKKVAAALNLLVVCQKFEAHCSVRTGMRGARYSAQDKAIRQELHSAIAKMEV